MELNNIGANQTEVELGNLRVFFSYNTPVAYFSNYTKKYYITNKKHSVTTSRHINSWLKQNNVKSVDTIKVLQSEVDSATN